MCRKSEKADKELTPNQVEIAKYEQEIAYWEAKMAEATAKRDWAARNWASTMINQKRGNLELLRSNQGLYGTPTDLARQSVSSIRVRL